MAAQQVGIYAFLISHRQCVKFGMNTENSRVVKWDCWHLGCTLLDVNARITCEGEALVGYPCFPG